MSDFSAALRAFLNTIAGAAVSVLPHRHWGRFDLPVTGTAWVSAIVTIAVGFFLGVHGYLRFVQALGDAAAAQVIELSQQIVEGRAQPVNPGIPLVSSLLGLFAFLLTPSGLVAAYLVGSGLVRAVGSATGQPWGDPLLTVGEAWYEKRRRRTEAEQARAARNVREGPEVPDVLVPGREAGFPEAEWVVIASRRKEGWEPGVVVVTTDRWYRLLGCYDRRLREGLRTFYALGSVAQAEVLRRSVNYDHPQLSSMHDGKDTTAPSAAEKPEERSAGKG